MLSQYYCLTLLLVETLICCLLMMYIISTVQVLMFLHLCDWEFCLFGVWCSVTEQPVPGVSKEHEAFRISGTGYPLTHGISQKNRTGYLVTHVVYPKRTELGTQWLTWYIPEEQNWVPSDSLGIFQKNRTGYSVTHLVYPRRRELGTQWLMWYIPEEQNWLSTPLWYIPEE
jgi:hypothetical protein